MDLRAEAGVLHEGREMLPQNLRRFDQRHLRTQRAVRPKLQRELVVVGLLADASFLDVVTHARHRAEHRVDRDDADLLNFLAVLGGRNVPAAILHDHFDDERHVLRQRRDQQVLVDDVHRLVGFDIRRAHFAGGAPLDADDLRRIAVVLHHERLDVQDNVGDVLHHAFNRRELVLSVVNLDLRDRAALEAREQNPPQAVPDRRAEAALERLGNELAVGAGERRGIADHLTGQLKSTPTNMHFSSPPTSFICDAKQAIKVIQTAAR
jgi:hypothetical protein